MLTLFTTPKPFIGHFDTIQRNAIQSWTKLVPKPEIIILDNVKGASEVALEFGLKHIPEIKRNEYGTPLVSSIFKTSQSLASNNLVCYINADNILTSSFIDGIQKAVETIQRDKFLLIGRRWNVFLESLWDFGKRDWEERLREYALKNGYQESAGATEYFIFAKDINWNIPPFAIGRGAWDGWFLYNACRMNVPLIDGTGVITIFHQQHDYSNLRSVSKQLTDGECRVNQRLRGSFSRQYTIWDAGYILTDGGLKEASCRRYFFAHILRMKMCATYYLHILHPYSYPIVVLLKTTKKLVSLLIRRSYRVKLFQKV